jgi:hypothetical protein
MDYSHRFEWLDSQGSFDLEDRYADGAQFWILYSPNDPDIALVDPEKAGLLSAVWNQSGFIKILMPFLALSCAVGALVFARDVILPSKEKRI